MNLSFSGERFALDYFSSFLDDSTSSLLFQYLETTLPWKQLNRRTNCNFGEDGLSYSVKFRDRVVVRTVSPWSECPVLLQIKERIEQLTGQRFTYCVVQRYPDGTKGINPHRDKEMRSGTIIAGVSLGAVRRLTMHPPSYNKTHTWPISVDLEHGSLYLFKPPTNDYWAHSIEQHISVTQVRISLTFRLA